MNPNNPNNPRALAQSLRDTRPAQRPDDVNVNHGNWNWGNWGGQPQQGQAVPGMQMQDFGNHPMNPQWQGWQQTNQGMNPQQGQFNPWNYGNQQGMLVAPPSVLTPMPNQPITQTGQVFNSGSIFS